MSEFGCSEYGERMDYHHNKCKNVISAILFYLQIAAVAIGIGYLFAVEFPKMNETLVDDGDQKINVGVELSGMWITISICSLSGLCIGLVWLQVIKTYPHHIITAVFCTAITCWIILFVVGLVVLNIGMIIIGACMAVVTALYLYAIYDLIPFSSILLAMAAKVVNIYGDLIWISILGVVLQLCWLFLWATLWGSYLYLLCWENYTTDRRRLLIVLMCVSLYWTLVVFNNIVRVSACGVAATWYFSADLSVKHKPTSLSLRSTLGTSFGSICLGSAFTPVLELCRVIVTTMARSCETRKNNCIFCCTCMTYTIDQIVRYSNTYAWAHVAIYGSDFITASKQIWKLFSHSGMKAIINGEVSGSVTFCGGIIGGIVNVAIGYGIAYIFYGDNENEKIRELLPVALGIYGGVSGFTLTMCILTIIRGFIVCIFVCYAEDGLLMQDNRPLYYNKLIKEEPRLINVTKNVAQGVPLTETEVLTAETK